MRDYYRMLGLPHGADLNEIRRAYRELARRCLSSRGNHGGQTAWPRSIMPTEMRAPRSQRRRRLQRGQPGVCAGLPPRGRAQDVAGIPRRRSSNLGGFGHANGRGTPIVDVSPQSALGCSNAAFHQ